MQIPPASQVLVLVLAAWTTGTVVLAAATRFGDEVDAGHFKVVWLVSTALALIWGFSEPLAWALAAVCAVAFAAIYARKDLYAGAGAAVVAAFVLGSVVRPVLFSIAAALLLGAVTNAMLLGHWHLNQPRLGTRPLLRLVAVLWAGLAAFAAAAGVMLSGALSAARDAAIVGGMTAVAFTAFSGVLAAMVTHLVRRRSIMSATGILYLQILLCLVAVFTGSLGALSPA